MRAVRLHAVGRTQKPPMRRYERASGGLEQALRARRPVWFDAAFVDTPVYDGDRVGVGHRLEGPAIVEERFTTIVLYPGHVAEVDRWGNYAIQLL